MCDFRKALEYERLIQLKASAASGYQINGVAQLVICLDLAARDENAPVDMVMFVTFNQLSKVIVKPDSFALNRKCF